MEGSTSPSFNAPARIGRYEVVGHLTYGGMAQILLARIVGPSGFERPVVLKRVLPNLAREPKFVSMFLDEARRAAKIRHANVVDVHELVQEGDELVLVMEYLEGENISGLSRRLMSHSDRLPLALAIHIVAEACAGLHAAHELKGDDGLPLELVHRDVSPQNLFVTYDGQVKVLDFGVAKARDNATRTETGSLKGKLEYMAPEQCRSEPVDRRADIFSLGAVLYELATGRRLFKRPTQAATMNAVLNDPIVPPSRVVDGFPADLGAICTKALQRDPAARYQTAAEMRRELLAVEKTMGADARPLDEELAALMEKLFSERRAEKEEMLRRVRAGSAPGKVPEAEVDEIVEIPTVAEFTEENSITTAGSVADAPSRRRRAMSSVPALAALVALALIAGAVSFLVMTRAHPEPGPAPQAASVEQAAPSAAASEQPLPSTITITVDTTPAGAEVFIGTTSYGTTPLDIALPRSDKEVTVTVRKDGFGTAHEKVVPDTTQRLRLTLAQISAAAPRPARGAAPRTTAPPKPLPAASAPKCAPDDLRCRKL